VRGKFKIPLSPLYEKGGKKGKRRKRRGRLRLQGLKICVLICLIFIEK